MESQGDQSRYLLNAAQLQGLKEVDLYRLWWENYDKMMKMNMSAEELPQVRPAVDPTHYMLVWLALLLLVLSGLLLLVWRRCRKTRSSCSSRRREAEESFSPRQVCRRHSLPPAYEVVVQEKEQEAIATGLPSYREACPV